MRVSINLSSDPFRRDRPVVAASWICAVLLVALLGGQVFLILAERDRAKETREAVNRLDAEWRGITLEQAQLDATLRQPANAEVLARSVLLNTLVDRKSISWTRIFADLESVMPYNVRLVQVRLPQINSRNEVTLEMEGSEDNLKKAVAFLEKKGVKVEPVVGDVVSG